MQKIKLSELRKQIREKLLNEQYKTIQEDYEYDNSPMGGLANTDLDSGRVSSTFDIGDDVIYVDNSAKSESEFMQDAGKGRMIRGRITKMLGSIASVKEFKTGVVHFPPISWLKHYDVSTGETYNQEYSTQYA